ncbi:MAG: UvrD-helicase domain-containing protein [Promethearchaeota archaeon]
MTHDQMKERMACQVCGKPEGLPLDECHVTMGKKNPLCNEYGKCRIAEKSEHQLNYAFSETNKNIFLKACPGGGKTEVVGLKTAYEIKRWNKEVGGIAVLTFTNNAADVISERVSQFAGIEKIMYPHFIGTFDSWLHGYIAHPFGMIITKHKALNGDHSIRLVENRSFRGFLNNYKTKYKLNKTGDVQANQYYLDYETATIVFSSGNTKLDDKRNKVKLEDWQKKDLHKTKSKFFKAGFATYQDIEGICLELLDNYKSLTENIVKRFPLIIIDECQDLSWIQLQILKLLKDKGARLHFVGDLNQAIYEFRKVNPKKVKEFIIGQKFEEHLLSKNFRSCQPIVDLCQKIVENDDEVISKTEQKCDEPCLCLLYQDKNDLPKLADWFERILIKKDLGVKDSIIVARGWSNVSKMRPSGNDAKINNDFKRLAMAVNLWNTRNISAIEDSIKYMGQFFSEKYFSNYASSSRKHYCPECVDSGIRWRIFLLKVLDKCINKQELIDFAKSGTEWANSIRSVFGQIARDCKPFLADVLTEIEKVDFPDFDGRSFRASDASNPVENLFSDQATKKSKIQINTIHSVKGQTFDSIMLVSAPSSKGTEEGYWSQWLQDRTSEAARLAYVASSRPKHLLIWAVPNMNDGNLAQLTELGFIPLYLDEDND